jgi:hypothetical protein
MDATHCGIDILKKIRRCYVEKQWYFNAFVITSFFKWNWNTGKKCPGVC